VLASIVNRQDDAAAGDIFENKDRALAMDLTKGTHTSTFKYLST
jgi:hypothetical protein